MSPTQRTIAILKRKGTQCAVVERWNQFVPRGDGGHGIRQDLFGFIDVVAIDSDRGLIAIQACAGASHAARRDKILAEPRAALWARHGEIEIWSWAKRVHKFKNGAKAPRWKVRVEQITLGDFG